MIEVGVGISQSATAVLSSFIASLTPAVATKSLLWLAYYAVYLGAVENQLLGSSETIAPVAKINFPKTGFATQSDDKQCTGEEERTSDSVSLSSTQLTARFTYLRKGALQRL